MTAWNAPIKAAAVIATSTINGFSWPVSADTMTAGSSDATPPGTAPLGESTVGPAGPAAGPAGAAVAPGPALAAAGSDRTSIRADRMSSGWASMSDG